MSDTGSTGHTDHQREPILTSTMQINPAEYSPQSASDRIEGTLYALAGLLFLLRRQPSVQLLTVISVTSMSLAFWLQIDLSAILLMMVAIGMVWTTESINTAIEAVVNLASPEYHPMAKVSKDVAAAATFIASTLASLVTVLTLAQPLWERLAQG
jgi:undecaprenol kinase/diacylglycerol kinase (ATP)